ncbi:MAG: hypothetical protein C4555_05160 [Dehalococcoidia bacterium]|nr:MAG: hypothetical protein C4555_05160 [Dehalococcoidia bacterium]
MITIDLGVALAAMQILAIVVGGIAAVSRLCYRMGRIETRLDHVIQRLDHMEGYRPGTPAE